MATKKSKTTKKSKRLVQDERAAAREALFETMATALDADGYTFEISNNNFRAVTCDGETFFKINVESD